MKLDLKKPEAFLKDLYTKAKAKYYEDPQGEQLLTDEQFDALEDHLKEVDPKWKGFKVGAPVVGKKKLKLPVPMFSLNKAKTEQAIQGFIDEGNSIVIMDKLDGSSLELIYDGGVPVQLITRGNGTIGGDVSYLIPHLRGVPPRISNKKRVIIRCEGLFSKAGFEKYRNDFDAARNAASGILNRKDIHKAVRDLQVVCLSVLEPNMAPSKGLTWLSGQKFKTVAWRAFNHERVGYDMLVKLLEKRKANSPYQIDGLVLTWDKMNVLPKSGNPVWSLAFKQNVSHDDAPRTTITNVEWKVSAHGRIVPKYNVEPIEMDGVTIRNAAAKNPKIAMNLGLGVGAVVGLVRSGDIIPEIVKVYQKAKFDMPSPRAFGAYHWDATETHIMLDDPKASPQVRAAKIARCFTILDIDYLRGATVNKLIDAGFDNVTKIIRATAEDFLAVDGFKEASANKLWNAIHEKTDKGFPLVQLMNASGVFPSGVGDRLLQQIADHHDLMELTDMSKADVVDAIRNIPGFEEKRALQIHSGLSKFVKWIRVTKLKVVERKVVKVKLSSSKLSNEMVSWTGYRSKEQEEEVVKNGGLVVPFGGKTTILLVTPTGKASGKAAKAAERGIPVLQWDGLVKKFKL